MDHEVQRLLLSDHYKVTSPQQLREEWTWDDVMDAHAILDAMEDYEAPRVSPVAARKVLP